MRWTYPFLIAVSVLFINGHAAGAPKIAPRQPEMFFTTPGEDATLVWDVQGDADKPTSIKTPFRISDYVGKPISEGDALLEHGKVSLKVKLPRGYYDVEVLGQVFGVVSQDAFSGKTDPFFGMDAVLTWLERRAPMRAAMVKDMKRSGIAMARERINWTDAEPEAGKWNWKADGLDTLRQDYADAGLPVLEMFHSPGPAKKPGAFPFRGSYPQDLGILSKSWPVIYNRFKPSWGALEVWNEPEGPVYGARLPADQYVMVVKAMRYTWDTNGIHSPLGGGVFMGGDPGGFQRFCALNGMLDDVDFVSIHDYKPATKIERLTAVYRAWLKENGKEGMPLWLTESGWWWPKGSGRPALLPDQESAVQIAMKGVEAKACGLTRYMPFCLPFYEEGGAKSFSMIGKDMTPLRSMGAYAQSIRVLSGKQYAGDLQGTGPGILRARVFEGGEQVGANNRVIVIYTDEIGPDKKVALPVKAARVEGIDGRTLEADADGRIAIPDGMAYVWAEGGAVKQDSPAMALLQASRQSWTNQASRSPVILQYIPDATKIAYSSTRYIASDALAGALPIHVRVHNLSAKTERVELNLALPWETGSTASRKQAVDVPPLGTADADWTVDTGGKWSSPEPLPITITANCDGVAAAPLAIPMQLEGDIRTFLNQYGRKDRLPIGDQGRWSSNMTAGGTMKLENVDANALRISFQFHGGDRWAYPRFRVAPGTLKGAGGFLVRARVLDAGDVRMTIVGSKDRTFITADPLVPADGKWHVFYVSLQQFEPTQDIADKDSGTWSPDEINAVSIGLNDRSTAGSNALEVSDLFIVGPGK